MPRTVTIGYKLKVLVGTASGAALVIKVILDRFPPDKIPEETAYNLERINKRLYEFGQKTYAEASQSTDPQISELLVRQRLEELAIAINELYSVLEPVEPILSADKFCRESVNTIYDMQKGLQASLEDIQRGKELLW